MHLRSIFVCGLFALLACAGEPARTVAPSEPDLPQGINERFLASDVDVTHYSEIFEGESREIYVSRAAIVEALDIRPGDVVADVGAGTGLFMEAFSAAVGPEGRVVAVDISPAFVEHLDARAADGGLANVDVVLGEDRSARLESGSLDLAFVCDTYHHFEYPRAMLADLRESIRRGGQLVIVEFERIPGVTADWILEHVRAGKDDFRAEIESAGFELVEELVVPGLKDNYILRFRRP